MCPTLQSAPHAKTHSGGVTLTERRILRRRRHRDVTKRRTLGGRRHGKPHFACGPHQKAHSACGRSGRVRLSVRVRAQNALFRRICFSLPAQTRRRLTENRTLHPSPHGKAQSAPATSRKTALCTRHLTENRTLHPPPHVKAQSAPATPPRRDQRAHSRRAASRKSALCVWASPKGALCMRAVVAPRAHLRRSMYTPAYPRPLSRPSGATGPTTSTAPWPP